MPQPPLNTHDLLVLALRSLYRIERIAAIAAIRADYIDPDRSRYAPQVTPLGIELVGINDLRAALEAMRVEASTDETTFLAGT